MSARQKLNSAHLLGSLLLAGLLGAWAESWFVFAIAAGILLAAGLHDGGIRPSGGRG